MAFADPWGKPAHGGFACMLLQGGCSFLYVSRLITLNHVTLQGTAAFGESSNVMEPAVWLAGSG